MGHAINYAVYERNVSRKAVLAEIQEEVMHEDWQEGGWYPDSQLKWHEDHVFETRELLLLGILMIVYSTWCWKLEPKCKVSSKMLSRIVLFSISVVALEFGAVLFYSTLSATDQKSISIERAFQAMREDGAVSGTAVLTDIDPGCRAELNGFKPYLDTRIEVFNGQNGQKNVLAEAGKALSSGSLSAICDDYGMDYAVLNYGINDVGIQDLEESGFKPVYSENLTVCLKRSTV